MEVNHEASIARDSNDAFADTQYNEPDDIARIAADMIDEAHKDFNKFKETNPEVDKNNLRIVKGILKRLHSATSKINNFKSEDRETYYFTVYNATVTIFEICRLLRRDNYYKLAARYLTFNTLSLDHNIILTTGKYLHWRVKNYIECARAHADSKSYQEALATITKAIQQVDKLKKIEELDPPVLDSDKQAMDTAYRLLKEIEIKYQLHSGALNPDQWRKKVEETFPNDKYHRALCVIESLSTDTPDNYIPIEKRVDRAPWKKDALTMAIQLINPDIEVVKEALIQIHEHKKKSKEAAGATMKSDNPEADVDEMLATHKQMNQDMIKEKEWKKASYNAPLEIHIQLIIFAYEVDHRDAFESLLKSALIRLKFRRYEVPYVSTVDILMSTSKDANIPNSFQKLPKDLNAANLRIELAKLKQAHKKKEEKEEEKKEPAAKGKEKPKDPKAKDIKEKVVEEPDEEQDVVATPEELEQIKHIYVNLLIQRSKNPKNAIVGLNVVMIDESSDYEIPENHYAVAVPIRQHEGVYERNKTIPYIMFKRTPNFLRDEDDLLSLVTDVTIIRGKSPHILPPTGYHKIPVDLRQTPHELERAPDADYVFICYKTDKDINVYERDLLTLKKLSDLTLSIVPTNDPKFDELPYGARNVGLIYDFELLLDITKNVKDSLLGPVGTFYSRERNDQLN